MRRDLCAADGNTHEYQGRNTGDKVSEVNPPSGHSGAADVPLSGWRKARVSGRRPADLDKSWKGIRERDGGRSSSSTIQTLGTADRPEKSAADPCSSSASSSTASLPSQQPHINRVPAQVIEEMCKRYHVNTAAVAVVTQAPGADAKETKRNVAANGEKASSAQNTVSAVGSISLSSPINQEVESEHFSNEDDLPALSKNEGDAILESLPTTYDEFESKEAATSHVLYGALSAAAGKVTTSTITSTVVDSHCLDPADLEVEMINASFEAQQSIALMYRNQHLKDLFYLHPNCPSTAGASEMKHAVDPHRTDDVPFGKQHLFSCETNALPVKHDTNGRNVPTATATSTYESGMHLDLESCCEKKGVGASKPSAGGLTWAGWKNSSGGGASGPSTPRVASRYLPKEPHVTSKVGSTSFLTRTVSNEESLNLSRIADSLVSIMLSGNAFTLCDETIPTVGRMRPAGECSPRSPSGSLVTGVQRFATVPTPSSDVNHDTKQLDLLSIEMAEKILNEDDHGISDDSDDSYRQPSPSIVAITTTATASTFTGSKFCDISHQQAANGQTTVDSWEELVDRPPGDLLDFVPSGQVDSSLSSSSVVFETADIDNRPEMKADEDDLGHILEAYNISSETKTEALYLLLKQQNCRSFTVEWVDNTHALVRFQSISAANDALRNTHSAIKLRALSQASPKSRQVAQQCKDTVQYQSPACVRPQTSAFVARRLVEGHLGMRPTARSRELRRQEKLVLDQAREKRKAAALVREELWEGKI